MAGTAAASASARIAANIINFFNSSYLLRSFLQFR
jgi:hypothetical protein